MYLIKNKDAAKRVTDKQSFCQKCSNKGFVKVVQKCDSEKFDELYDKYDSRGWSADQVYDAAIEQCRYDCYYCPDCEKGQNYKDKYPVYKGI